MVRVEFPYEERLCEPIPCNGHRASIRFKEEGRSLPDLRQASESEAEDPIRLHAQAMTPATCPDFNVPAERSASTSRRLGRSGEHLLGLD
jgi:hypothetical protein